MFDLQKNLSRRQRQILDILFEMGEATVLDIQARLPEAPTPMAIRRMLQILEEDKSLVKRRKSGRSFVYMASLKRGKAGVRMLNHVIKTFFGGSFTSALTAHLSEQKPRMEGQEWDEIEDAIRKAREEGR